MGKFPLLGLSRFVQFGLVALVSTVLLAPAAANATPYVIHLTQQGNNVVASGSGAIDLTDLPLIGPGFFAPSLIPGNGEVLLGDGLGGFDVYGVNFMGPSNFGPGSETDASNTSGDVTGIYDPAGQIAVPTNYISDTALSSTATWDNATFASLGVTPGTYTWTWGTGADQSFTLDIVNSVPEPAALGMFGLGVLLIGGFVGLCRRIA